LGRVPLIRLRHHVYILGLLINDYRGRLVVDALWRVTLVLVGIVVMAPMPAVPTVTTTIVIIAVSVIAPAVASIVISAAAITSDFIAAIRVALGRDSVTNDGTNGSAGNFAVALAKLGANGTAYDCTDDIGMGGGLKKSGCRNNRGKQKFLEHDAPRFRF